MVNNTAKTISLALLTISAVSTPANGNNFFKTGFITGYSVGLIQGKSNITQQGTAVGIKTSAVTQKDTATGIIASLFSGYRNVSSSGFMYGINADLSLDSNKLLANETFNTINGEVGLKRQFSISPGLLIGQRLNGRWAIFGILSASISKFTIKTKTQYKTGDKSNFVQIGLAPTIGAEYAVNQKISVFGSASYEMFKSKKKSVGELGDSVPFNVFSHDVTVKPKYFTVKVGIIHKF